MAKTVHHRSRHAAAPEAAPEKKKRFPLKSAVIAAVVLCFAAIAIYFMLPHGPAAASGDKVSVDYTGRLDSGKVFDTSIESIAKEAGIYASARNYAPLEFALGQNQMIPGFENAVLGMRVGERKTVRVLPEDAYGYPQPSMVENLTIPKYIYINYSFVRAQGLNTTLGSVSPSLFGPATLVDLNSTTATFELSPVEGATVAFPNGVQATIASVTPEGSAFLVVLDGNHPLAGQPLTFEITLVSIAKGT